MRMTVQYLEFKGKVPRMVMLVGSTKYPCIQVEDAGRVRQIIQTDNELHYRELLKYPYVAPLTEITPEIKAAVAEFTDRAQKRAQLIALEKETNALRNRSKEALAAAKSTEERARRTAIEADHLAKSALELAQEAEKQAKLFDQKQAELDALQAEMAPSPAKAPQEQPTPPSTGEKTPPEAAPKKNGKGAKRAKKETK